MSTAVQQADRAEWLEWRRGGIGASDTPAILGLDPYRSPLDVYFEKTGERDEEPANLPCRVGLALEDLIAELYQEETGDPIIETQVTASHDDHPFIRATIDGVTECGRIVEFKTTHSYSKGLEIGEAGTDEIPQQWIVQVHAQMLATGKSLADVAILRGNSKFSVHTVEFDPDLGRLILDVCVAFWHRVETRNPPPATRGSDCRVLAKLYPEAEGETTLDGPANLAAMTWLDAKEKAATWGKIAEDQKAAILSALGPHALGRLPDGRILKRSVVHVKERTNTVKAHDQVRLTISKGASE